MSADEQVTAVVERIVAARVAAAEQRITEVRALGESWVGFDDSHHYGDAVLKALGALARPTDGHDWVGAQGDAPADGPQTPYPKELEMNLHTRVAEVLERLEWQAEQAGTAPAGLAWQDAADMVRAALARPTDEATP